MAEDSQLTAAEVKHLCTGLLEVATGRLAAMPNSSKLAALVLGSSTKASLLVEHADHTDADLVVADPTKVVISKKEMLLTDFYALIVAEAQANLKDFKWGNICKKLAIKEGDYNETAAKNAFERNISSHVCVAAWFSPGGGGAGDLE